MLGIEEVMDIKRLEIKKECAHSGMGAQNNVVQTIPEWKEI